jgi:hypothetical protein
VFPQGLIVVVFYCFFLHIPEGLMVELKKLVGRNWVVPSGGGANGPSEFLPAFLFLFIPTLGPDELLSDKLNIDILGEQLLFFRIGADAVLNAHAIDSVGECGVEGSGELLDFLQGFVLGGEDSGDVSADGVEGLVVLKAVLAVVGVVERTCRFRTDGQRTRQLTSRCHIRSK